MSASNIRWSEINEKMLRYCKAAFSEDGLNYAEVDIKSAIELFHLLCQHKMNYALLDGIGKDMGDALQDVCCDKIGQFAPLKNISTSLEPFLKRIVILLSLKTYTELEQGRIMLLKLYEILHPYLPALTHNNIEDFAYCRGCKDGSYILAEARNTRNNVHNNPDWDDSEVTRRVKYVIAAYIFIVLKCKDQLLVKLPTLKPKKVEKYFSNEDKRLYDFFCYGKTAKKIKDQVIESFIVHYLYNKESEDKQQLIDEILAFSMNSLDNTTINRIIKRMQSEKRIDIDKSFVKLTRQEYDRVSDVIFDYDKSLQYLQQDIDSLLEKYGRKNYSLQYLELLDDFFSKNYSDFYVDKDNFDDSKFYFDKIRERLSNVVTILELNRETCDVVLTETLNICKNNDILIRKAASSAISRLTDVEQFSTVMRDVNHDVYLDTQILLYALCGDEEYANYDDLRFQIVKDFFEFVSHSNNITLKVSSNYVDEVIYHIKRALLLIQYDEIPTLSGTKFSNNVFYCHYLHLKNKDGLPQGVESFADYLDNMFNLTIDDAFSNDFYAIAKEQVSDIIKDFDIDIVEIEVKDNNIEKCKKIFDEEILNHRLRAKDFQVAQNDAKMGAYLFVNNDDVSEPFFITWDRSFSYFKSKYSTKFIKGMRKNMWKLFSPSQLVDYVGLINFKVNTSSLTNELLSIMSDVDFQQNTGTIFDRWSKYLDISNYDKGQRKKYIDWFLSIENAGEFDYGALTIEDTSTLIDILPAFLTKRGNNSFKHFKNILADDMGYHEFCKISKKYQLSSSDMKEEEALKEIEVLLMTYEQ